MLKRHYGLKDITFHRVPGEKGHQHLLSNDAILGEHWPQRFVEIMEQLTEPLNGRLYLVAAGILGKLYCNQIKCAGGIAIDIGSLADGWMGHRTRPGLKKLPLG